MSQNYRFYAAKIAELKDHRSAKRPLLARSYGAMAEVQADKPTRIAVFDEVSASLKPYVGANGLAYPIEALLASARK